jgi:hypothetical protein
MSIDTAETELANEFASFTPEALKKHFDDLNEAIRAKAEPVKQNLCLLKSGVDDLVPHLAVMQSFLSQRGSARDKFRKAHLPTWTTWFKSFNKDTGLNVTLRAVQKQLAKLRGAYKREKSDPPVKLSAKNQRRLLTVHQYANEIVAAVENSADCSEVMREYKKVAMDSVRIGQLLESAATDDDAVEQTPAQVPVAAAEGIKAPPVIPVPAATQKPQPRARSVSLPKPGDCSGLVSNISQLCGDHLKAGLEGLEPEVMTRVFGTVIQRLAQMYCVGSSGSGVEMKVTVEYVGRKPPTFAKEASLEQKA